MARRMSFAVLSLLATFTCVLSLQAQQPAQPIVGSMPEERTVQASMTVLKEAVSTPDRGIPRSMLAKAQGVVIVPRLIKVGLVAGVRHGKGVLISRDAQGNWQAPLFVTMTGGSVGWQVGVASSDLVLVFHNRGRVDQLKQGRFTIGVDAAAAAGPVGRRVEAGTDARLSAEIYSYARTRGLFAGVSVDGAALQVDQTATQAYYASGAVPTSALNLLAVLQNVSTKGTQPAGTQPAPAGQPGQPVTAAPPASTAIVDAESLRKAYTAQWSTLAALLPEDWKRYLAPPTAVEQPGQAIRLDELQELLKRYDRVAGDAKYAVLTNRPEFQAARGGLQQFVTVLQTQAKSGQPLTLPPPPGQ